MLEWKGRIGTRLQPWREAQEGVVGVKTRTRTFLHVHGLQLPPHRSRIVSNGLQMRLLLPLHTCPDLPSCQVHPVVKIAQIAALTGVERADKRRPRLSTLHNAQSTKSAKPGLHIELPLLVVAIVELGEGRCGWRHGCRSVTWRATGWQKDGAKGRKLREISRKDGAESPRERRSQAENRKGWMGTRMRS